MPKITVNGVSLYYELHGDSDEVLVLNNGVIASTSTWTAFQLPALLPHTRVLLYDMRGQGQSQKWMPGDAPYSWESHADDLAALMEALGISQAHIGGISYGGELSLVFALRYQERCRSLIVADAVSHVEPHLRAIVESWAMIAERGDHELFYKSTWYWNFSPQFFGEQYDFLLSRVDAAKTLHLPSVAQLCRCFLTLDITSQLGAITQPACVLVGEKDLLKPVHYAKIIANMIPSAELHVLRGAGHASFWENASEFNRLMVDFLTRA